MRFLGKLLSAPIKAVASTVRVGGQAFDFACGDDDLTPERNILDDIAETVECDVDGMTGGKR